MSQKYSSQQGSWKLGLVLSIALACGLGYLLYTMDSDPSPTTGDSLHIYCAAGMRLPLEEVAAEFEKEFGTKIILDYGSSGELEGKIQLETENGNPRADVYIPADVGFVNRAREKKLVRESFPLAKFQVSVAVKPGNPKEIKSLNDFFTDGIGYVICNEQAGVGKRTKGVLSKYGLYDKICKHTAATKPRVTEAAMAIKTSDKIDAGLIWDTEALKNGLEIVNVPELKDAHSTVTAAVTEATKKPTLALMFCRYLSAPGKGLKAFIKHKFNPIPGDPWAERPELIFYSGGVNRVALEDTVAAFEKREGVSINVKYAGCGLLVQDIKASPLDLKPDVFLTCDASYLPMVGDYFLEGKDVSRTAMGLLVQSQSTKEIKTLKDLAKEEVAVGIADPEKTALGALTLNLLDAAGVKAVVTKKMITAPSAHELRLMLEAHKQKLDVAIVYEANAQNLDDTLNFIPIDHPLAHATQNMATGKASKFPNLSTRLKTAIISQTSKSSFTTKGFSWMADIEKP